MIRIRRASVQPPFGVEAILSRAVEFRRPVRVRDASEATEEVLPSSSADEPGVAEPVAPAPRDQILRLFDDDYLELVRLLRETSEIEHALMVQYLYAAFSIRKDRYPELVGGAFSDPNSLLGVAVQEMEHLRLVADALAAIDAAPNLSSQDFPYETDIYPFPLHLERLSDSSVARYAYTEAPVAAMSAGPENPDPAFTAAVLAKLGEVRPNHVGSVYGAIIELAERVAPEFPLLAPLIPQLEEVRRQGEEDHFQFFKAVFLGTHPGFAGVAEVWQLSPGDPAYPSLPTMTDPSAIPGHPRQIPDENAFLIAALGNLYYWSVLLLLDMAFRYTQGIYASHAKRLMTTPLARLGEHLPTLGYGLPFDPLDTGYSAGRGELASRKIVIRVLESAKRRADAISAHLPSGFSNTAATAAITALQGMDGG